MKKGILLFFNVIRRKFEVTLTYDKTYKNKTLFVAKMSEMSFAFKKIQLLIKKYM